MLRVSLHIGPSTAAAWENIALPWFQEAARASWRQQESTLVVVPSYSHAYAIKSLLLDRGESILGVRFVTPPSVRELFSRENGALLALREHLRLILSITAEESMQLPDDLESREKRMLDADFLAAKSVARAPDHLLRTIDQLGAAGWDFSAVEPLAMREIGARFQKRLARCGFELVHTADRRALQRAKANPVLFANVLLTGFNGAHWPMWPLLRAAVTAAKEATVLLEDPRDESRDVDEKWIGTWEEIFGEAKTIPAPTSRVTGNLFSEEEMRGVSDRQAARTFLVGANTTEQAEAVTHQCLTFLAEPECDRVGIIFAGTGSLSRLVANALTRLEVAHHDGIAHFVPGIFEAADWQAWLELQRSPRVNSLIRFITAFAARGDLLGEMSPNVFERTLRSAYAEVLIDNLEVLKHFCAQEPKGNASDVAKILEAIPFLPSRGRLPEFLKATRIALDKLGWKSHWLEISRRLGDWTGKLDSEFSRGLYLRWLDEMASTFVPARELAGDHPYARVQLLTVAQAPGQRWSHLIFAGWNEGSWPPPESGEFARQDEIDAFNRSIAKLNLRAARQGRYGEGHVAIKEDHTLYLGPIERRQIALRQYEALVESVTGKIAFSASLVEEEAPERLWNPSELFTQQYQETHGAPLTQKAMSRLQESTRRWLNESPEPMTRDGTASRDVEITRIAYDARRNPNEPSGEYDFAFRSKPNAVPILSVSEFEQLISSPALVWLKKYLGVKAAEEGGNVWNTSTGKWVHDWLAAIATGPAQSFSRLPDAAEIERRVCAAAETKRSDVTRLCQAAGKPVPDWWSGGCRNAVFLARALADKLTTVADWPFVATEWTVEGDFNVNDKTALSLRGRIDLLLARTKPAAGSFATDELWIVDYKTGAKKALATARKDDDGRRPALKKKLLDGSALQLALYSLAATALGVKRTEVSLLSPLVRPFRMQISGSDFMSEAAIFEDLAKMQQTGVFGMHGPLRSAYRFIDDYPLATLAVDPEILEQRWELTHPALVRDEEDLFW